MPDPAEQRRTLLVALALVIANVALMLSGAIVLLTGFGPVDLIVGAAIGGYVIKEAVEILSEARKASR